MAGLWALFQMVVFFSRDGKGSGFFIAGNIKSSVLYDAQKLRRLQLGLAQEARGGEVGTQWA